MRIERSGFLCLALCTACASYQAEPVAPPPAAAQLHPLEEERLRVRARELDRAALPQVTIDLSDGIDPDEAAVLAVLLDPDLVAARDAQGEANAQVIQAGILPNPVLGVEYAHPYGAGASGTTDVWNLTLSQDITPLLSRSAHRSAAEASLAEIDLGIAWEEWQVAQRARLLVVRLEWLHKRVALAREELAFEEQTSASLERASGAGDVTLGQVGVQRASLESVRRTVDDLEQLVLDAESELRALFGNPRLARLDVPEPKPPALSARPDVATCMRRRLDLQALERGYNAQEEAVRAAVIDQFPDLTIGIAHQHNESAMNFIGAFVDVGLPIFNRNQGQIAVARATRRRLQHEYDARVAGVRADVDRFQRLSALVGRQLPAVHAAIAPLEKIENDERGAVVRGDVDRLSYQTVRAALLDQRLQETALSQALAEAEIGLETTCGGGR